MELRGKSLKEHLATRVALLLIVCTHAYAGSPSPLEQKAEAFRLALFNEAKELWDQDDPQKKSTQTETAEYIQIQPIITDEAKPPPQEFQVYTSRMRQNIGMIQKGVTLAQIPRTRILARVTAYWAEGAGTDEWSAKNQSSTQQRLVCLHHAAVDPEVIPYGSKLLIQYDQGRIAVEAIDTGGDVKNRRAARNYGKTPQEQAAPVVDIFFQKKEDAIRYTQTNPPYQWVEVIPPNQG